MDGARPLGVVQASERYLPSAPRFVPRRSLLAPGLVPRRSSTTAPGIIPRRSLSATHLFPCRSPSKPRLVGTSGEDAYSARGRVLRARPRNSLRQPHPLGVAACSERRCVLRALLREPRPSTGVRVLRARPHALGEAEYFGRGRVLRGSTRAPRRRTGVHVLPGEAAYYGRRRVFGRPRPPGVAAYSGRGCNLRRSMGGRVHGGLGAV